jgi:hypothetical protein
MKTPPYWPLKLSFKGNRNYLQGGDIHNAVNRLAGELTGRVDAYVSKIAFRKFARQDCDLVGEKPEDEAALVADGTVTAGNNPPIQFWVIETFRPAIGRYDYDEQPIVSAASIHGKTIILDKQTPYTPIEEVIALTKVLCYALAPDVDGKWLFGQLNLLGPLAVERIFLSIEQKALLANRFSTNAIYQDNVYMGDIRFIGGNP